MEPNIFKKGSRFALIKVEGGGLIEVDLELPHLQFLSMDSVSGKWLEAGRFGKPLRKEGREYERVLHCYRNSLLLMEIEGKPKAIYQAHEGYLLEVERGYIQVLPRSERLAYFEKGKMSYGRELEYHIKLKHYPVLEAGTEEYGQALKDYRTRLERVSVKFGV